MNAEKQIEAIRFAMHEAHKKYKAAKRIPKDNFDVIKLALEYANIHLDFFLVVQHIIGVIPESELEPSPTEMGWNL